MSRNFDHESGKNRLRQDRAFSRDEEESFVPPDRDLEEVLDMPSKDDSTRRGATVPPIPHRGKRDGRNPAISGNEDDGKQLSDNKKAESKSKVAPHMAILIAATYHIGLSIISRPTTSSFIPSCFNMFTMLNEMIWLVADNTLLHEMCPEFFSPVLVLYYAHAFYYQMLRARSAAGSDVLTRNEKRALTYYERVAPPEAWPIAGPLLGFLGYLGAHKTSDPMFSWIVPALPAFKQLGEKKCLSNLDAMIGSSRIPLVPAIQKLIYNFAHGIAQFDDDYKIILPVGQRNLDATHTFCGLTSSAATNVPFQILSGNFAWFAPPETGDTIGSFDYDIKQARIRRWNIPDVPDNADLTSLSAFLGFSDDVSFDWMKHLLSNAATFNRFFPGSGNLSQVSPLTQLGMATQTTYKRTVKLSVTKNNWFYPRESLVFSTLGYSTTEDGLLDTKMSITPSWNAGYDSSDKHLVRPCSFQSVDPDRDGPFFLDDGNNALTERMATIYSENSKQVDPARRFSELLASHYDNRGGRP